MYYHARTELAKAVQELVDIAKAEIKWEDKHSSCGIGVMRSYAAINALEDCYKKQCLKSQNKFEGVSLPAKLHNSQRKDLKVEFSEGTSEDTRHRPIALFSRSCAVYGPDIDVHAACKEGRANYGERSSWEFNVHYCRMLLCDRPLEQPIVGYCELTAENDKERILGPIRTKLAILIRLGRRAGRRI